MPRRDKQAHQLQKFAPSGVTTLLGRASTPGLCLLPAACSPGLPSDARRGAAPSLLLWVGEMCPPLSAISGAAPFELAQPLPSLYRRPPTPTPGPLHPHPYPSRLSLEVQVESFLELAFGGPLSCAARCTHLWCSPPGPGSEAERRLAQQPMRRPSPRHLQLQQAPAEVPAPTTGVAVQAVAPKARGGGRRSAQQVGRAGSLQGRLDKLGPQ